MFGQILEKLDTWIGRSFLLASFFPFLIFVAANITMTQILIPDVAKELASFFSGSIYGSVSATAVGLAAVAALAYLTDPLVGVMTKLLEGAYIPQRLAGLLAADQAAIVRDLREREQSIGRRATDILAREKSLLEELRAEQRIGDGIGAIRDYDLIEKARKAIWPLQKIQNRQRSINLAQLESAAASLKEALRANCMDRARLAVDEDDAALRASAQLNLLFQSTLQLIDYAKYKALDERSRVIEAKLRSFAPNELPATKFGNLAAALRGFCETTFQLDFEFFWPVVQIVAQADPKTTDLLVNAKQKLDFCIRVLMFTVVFTAVWLVVAAFAAQSIYTVPVIGTTGFLATMFWLEIVYENYKSFAELVRSVIILKRFDVLKMLHYQLPATWAEERQTWDEISTQLRWGSEIAITYQHPDK
jgi:hypothetical protein